MFAVDFVYCLCLDLKRAALYTSEVLFIVSNFMTKQKKILSLPAISRTKDYNFFRLLSENVELYLRVAEGISLKSIGFYVGVKQGRSFRSIPPLLCANYWYIIFLCARCFKRIREWCPLFRKNTWRTMNYSLGFNVSQHECGWR